MATQREYEEERRGGEGEEQGTNVKVGVSVTGLFSRNPTMDLTIPISRQTREIGKSTHTLVSDLEKLTAAISGSGLVTNLKQFSNTLSTASNKLLAGMESTVDVFSSLDLIFETITGLGSLASMVSVPLTPMSILTGLYTLYKLIRAYVTKLPKFVRTLVFGIELVRGEPEDQYFDAELTAESSSFINIAYTGLIMLLPVGVRNILDTFQKYTRVKILEDLDWVYVIADVVLHIPSFVIDTISKGVDTLPTHIAEKIRPTLSAGHQRFEELLAYIPEVTTSKHIRILLGRIQTVHEKRTLLNDVEFVSALGEDITMANDHLSILKSRTGTTIVQLQSMVTEATNLYKTGVYMVQKSHPEPVAVLLYSEPGCGKTTFTQQIRRFLTGDGKNTVYDYTPTEGRSDFHDQYHDQNVWIHEDIGQRGEQDWAQYINHIGVNPSRMDGAALDKKSTIFFRSQVILGTTNINIHEVRLQPVTGCGWKNPEAIYRRWRVVDYERGKSDCLVYRYSQPQHRWLRCRDTIDCSNPKEFSESLRTMYTENVAKHQALVNVDFGSADFSFGDLNAEGRKKEILIDGGEQQTPVELELNTGEAVLANHPRNITVHFDTHSEEINFTEEKQQSYLAAGLLINGGKEIVGVGEVHVGTLEGMWLRISSIVAREQTRMQEIAISAIELLRAGFKVVEAQVAKEYLVAAGVLTGLGLMASIAIGYWWSSKNKEQTNVAVQPFMHWAKSTHKIKASALYAEGGCADLRFDDFKSEAQRAIGKNVLDAQFSVHEETVYSHAVMIDADTLITMAHTIMRSGSASPKEVFVRAFDKEERERIAAFFVVVRVDLAEDLAVLRYKNPHQQIFRSLARSMLKEPSNKELSLVTNRGTLPIGVPQRCEVTSGFYRVGKHSYTLPQAITHTYDGIATKSPGLCGALATTLDGYIVGWHVANDDKTGHGYVRLWNKETRDFVLSGVDHPQIPILRETVIKGAMIVETTDYHHVSLVSGLIPSAMLEHMKEEPLLCPDKEPLRQPAVLGGKREVDGVIVRTYDYSREKNLSSIRTPISLKALNFARIRIRQMLKKVLPGGKIRKLTREEMVKGYNNEDGILRRSNIDAAAGVPLGGLVKDWIDVKTGTIRPEVDKLIQEVESLAAKGKKHFDKVLCKDCNKDEMRDSEKKDKPRCFAACPLHFNLLIRQYFGAMTTALMQHRLETGIMIGVNATSSEWQTLWKKLCCFTNHFDGDYEMWDGGMRREFQEALNEEISACTDDPLIALTLLMYLCETTHIGMNTTYITTHSVPSGHGLTASYNSLINVMYVSYAWYLLVGEKLNLSDAGLLAQIASDLYAPVYGDDIVCAVADRISQKFNAVTYGAVMRDIGLGFTSASKAAHTSPFSALRDITFLKRNFAIHRTLSQIVGPLQLKVLVASAGYVSDTGRDQEITTQKLCSLQRELFLHPTLVYQNTWASICRAYENAFGIPYVGLTECEMIQLYTKGELRSDMFELNSESKHETIRYTRRLRRLCRGG